MKPKQASHAPATVLMQPTAPEVLRWDMQTAQLAIARRAYELFETRNREHGHDWEDWFQAESELLRPVSIAISGSARRLSIRANVLGFAANELKVSLESKRIVIFGKKEFGGTDAARPATDFCPDLILRMINLPAEVDPDSAVVELESGILKFELSRLAKSAEKAAAAGKG
jgi:HSP20 family molecular chaperone IbpA